MKRRIILFVAAVGMVSCGTSQTKDNDPWGEIDPGQVEAQSVAMDRSVHSQAMNRDMTYSVWLPNGYDEKKTYPFLYRTPPITAAGWTRATPPTSPTSTRRAGESPW